ncbi:hypothetical protein Y1Q_0015628 [Alligator mississippiensis]|uniref:Uncharacterized protein n=1 Tax=Alligator mississippiensis TaxID=8496 RepID=A0A151NNF2_ALLMI|nr:hypothetical protein Y1Q_0015628 [Alligator mississippiensis]
MFMVPRETLNLLPLMMVIPEKLVSIILSNDGASRSVTGTLVSHKLSHCLPQLCYRLICPVATTSASPLALAPTILLHIQVKRRMGEFVHQLFSLLTLNPNLLESCSERL